MWENVFGYKIRKGECKSMRKRRRVICLIVAGMLISSMSFTSMAADTMMQGAQEKAQTDLAEQFDEAQVQADNADMETESIEESEEISSMSETTATGITSLKVGGQIIVEDGEMTAEPLPAGAAFDEAAGVLTLSDYHYTGDQSLIDAIGSAESKLIISLEGDNTYISERTSGATGIISSVRNTIMEGAGRLTMSGSIYVGMQLHDFTMNSGTVTIDSTTPYTFYGINGSYGEQHYYDFAINGGTVNISCHSEAENKIGIDVQSGDLTIKNANVNIDLGEADKAFGLCAGWCSNEGTAYGGDLTIENAKVNVNIQGGTSVGISAYFYKMITPDNTQFYCGNTGLNYHFSFLDTFDRYDGYMSNRYQCYYNQLMITDELLEDGIPFTDVDEEAWYYTSTKYVNDHGLMTGLDSTHFGPTTILSRAQFATILYRMEDSPSVNYETKYPDVMDRQFYTSAVMWASEAGVIGGYANGYFGPADNITREQMAVMMYRFAKYKEYDISASNDLSSFPDQSSVSAFSKDAMKWAVGAGLISGSQGNLLPQGNASRAECATIIMRFMEYYKQI